ncbi:hypothetical protein EsVE80_12040 [Enterococcus saigonensis]|uniref:Viral A-type inclusion protein n=1 Tax=Enterococcus saigonensis TaxID=1805431 RepID=A0A679ILT9_9ENTE|nr:viral A-type inclusion protein [Enterococcus saigonensis]BCA85681.1 hypothetical protein EsVE80_12040 [Enterococcus saigonensis]
MTNDYDELNAETIESEDSKSFSEIKEVASKNIGQMLHDLQDFELAIKEERIPDIYRIYNGRLHDELKKTSNANHEIDQLLTKKIHDNFMASFPFMRHHEKISETLNYYRIGDYYRQRASIGIDASIPEIFIIPKIDSEWESFISDHESPMKKIEQEIDQLTANAITAKMQIEKLDEKLKELIQKEKAIENNKSFFNRGKTDEELETLLKQKEELSAQRAKWLPFVEEREKTLQQKEVLEIKYQQLRLNRALVIKEFRQIKRYFGDLEVLQKQLANFIAEYLNKGGKEND